MDEPSSPRKPSGPAPIPTYPGPGYPTYPERRGLRLGLAAALASAALGPTCFAGEGDGSPPAPDPDGSGTRQQGWLDNAPSDPDPPRMAGEIMMPVHDPIPDPPTADPVPPTPEASPPEPTSVAPSTPSTAVLENQLRSVYLNGTTREGKAFVVMVRLDPQDDAAFQAVLRERKSILAALAPLAEDPALAIDHAGYHRVQGLLPGVRIRDAGVVREPAGCQR